MRAPTLWKKSLRDLWQARWYAAGLALLVGVAVALVAGTSRGRGMLDAARDDCLQRLNAADLDIRCSPTLPGVLSRAASLPGVVQFEERMLLDGVLKVPGAPATPALAQMLRAERPTIYALDVIEGRWPNAGEEALLLDRSIARVRGIALGDELTLELVGVERTLPVVGVTRSAEYVVHPAHPDFEVPIPGAYAVVQVSAAAAVQFPYSDRVDSLLFRCEPGTDLKTQAAMLLDVLPVAAMGTISSETDPSRRFVDMVMNTFGVATGAVTFALLFVVLVMFVITIVRRVRSQQEHIGTLLTLGHRPLPIALSMLGHSVVPTLVGGLLGHVAHHRVARHIFDAHEEAMGWAPLVDPGPGKEGLLTIALGIGIGVVACLVPALASSGRMPAPLLRPPIWQSAGSALRPMTRWMRTTLRAPIAVVIGLSSVLRRRWATLSTVLALAATLAVMLAFWFVELSHRRETTTTFSRLGLDAIGYLREPHTTATIHGASDTSWKTELNISRPAWFEFPGGSTFLRISALEADGWISHFPLVKGRTFSAPDAPEIYIDRWVSNTYGIALGDKVMAFPYFSAPEGMELEVVGILGGITINIATIPIETGRALWGLPDMATAVHVASTQPREALVASLRALPDVQHVTVMDDARAHANKLFSASRVVISITLLLGVIVAVIYLAVLAAADVLERSADLATLRALGWRDRSMLSLCLTEVIVRGYAALLLALPVAPYVARWILDRIGEANHYSVALHHDAWMYGAMAALVGLLVPLGALPAWRLAVSRPRKRLARLLSRV